MLRLLRQESMLQVKAGNMGIGRVHMPGLQGILAGALVRALVVL
jgi:hypothetical protein